jgi:hypothetical protein
MIGCGQALPGDNMPARLYAKWLAAFLGRRDRRVGKSGCDV